MADNVNINPGTTTAIATDDVSGVQFQKMKINLGGDGVDGNTWDGKVAVTAGTIGAFTADIPGGTIDSVTEVANVAKGTITRIEGGTITANIGDVSGGTIDLNTRVGNVGTIESGTITSVGALPDLPGGTIDSVTAVAAVTNLDAGTVTEVGTVTGVGVVTSITTLPDLPGGTIDSVTAVAAVTNVDAGTITEVGTVTGAGTVANVGVIHNAGTVAALPDLPGGTVDVVSAVSNGSIVVTAGTIGAFTADIPGGTIDAVTSVTNLAGGTVQLNPKPSQNIITYGTTVGGTAATGVTLLSAPGTGTSIYINEISIVNQGTATAQVHVGFGTASTLGTSHVVGGIYAGNGGIQKTFPKPVGGHITNLALLGSITAAGTANVNLSYWVE